MKRRTFIAGLGGAAAWPLVARGQPASKLPIIGFLGGDHSVWSPWAAAFAQRLRELGWIEDRTVTIEYRWAEGHAERYTDFATEFVHLKVNVVVTFSPAATVVKQATSEIPIVFAIGNDPVGDGLVASLARPGGNVTGLSIQTTDLAGKRIEILREIVPGLRRLAVMYHVDDPSAATEQSEAHAIARMIGIEVTPLEIRETADILPALSTVHSQVDAIYVVQGSLVGANRDRIIALALEERLPIIFNPRDHVRAGALMSYGPSFVDLLRRTADIVDKILRGTKPGQIPVEQPTKFDLVINLKTAGLLGLAVPPMLLARADEVIE
jgi:putative ABC transport system substrate-binding protein